MIANAPKKMMIETAVISVTKAALSVVPATVFEAVINFESCGRFMYGRPDSSQF